MSSIKGFTFYNEKLDNLLRLYYSGQMSLDDAQDLLMLLEPLHKELVETGDLNRARNIARILTTVKGFLAGRISLIENIPISERLDVKKIKGEKAP